MAQARFTRSFSERKEKQNEQIQLEIKITLYNNLDFKCKIRIYGYSGRDGVAKVRSPPIKNLAPPNPVQVAGDCEQPQNLN
jgi:hypothetical protein